MKVLTRIKTRVAHNIDELLRLRTMRANKQKMRNRSISIISNNCISRIIAHDLGLRFNSPTVNLFIPPEHFVLMCEHLNEFMLADLKEKKLSNEI